MLYLFFFFGGGVWGSRVMLIIYSTLSHYVYYAFKLNFSCILVFPNVSQRQIAFSTNIVHRLAFPY